MLRHVFILIECLLKYSENYRPIVHAHFINWLLREEMDCKKWCLVLASVSFLAVLEQAESYTGTVEFRKADSKNSPRTEEREIPLKEGRTFGGLRHKETRNPREKQVKRTRIS